MFASDTITIGFDGSSSGEDALAFGGWLARAGGLRPYVVCVYPEEAVPTLPGIGSEWVKQMREGAEEALERARGLLENGTGAEYRAIGAASPAHGLDNFAEASGAGAIVLGSSHRGAFRRVGASTIADRLLHGASVPVAVAPSGTRDRELPRPRTVGCAFLLGPEGEQAIAGAAALARRLAAELKIFTVLAHGAELPITDPYIEQAFVAQERARLTAGVETAARTVPADVSASIHLLEGDVVDALAELDGDDCDVLVCGSRHYGPVRRVLLGGVSSRLVRRATSPVIVVPRGDG